MTGLETGQGMFWHPNYLMKWAFFCGGGFQPR
jgi:hypothetical protein